MTMILDGTLGITATGSLTGLTTAITPAQGGTGLTAVGSSGNLLTSNGTAWTSTAPAASGGMTLLGTLTTTSGTSQTLSALTLTNYKFLQISVNNVGYSSGTTNAALAINTYNFTRDLTSTVNQGYYGMLFIDLSSGAAVAPMTQGSFTVTNSVIFSAGDCYGNLSAINTSTTSLAFTFNTGNTFGTGTIKVYGVS